jgi:hypothetical protein
MAFPERTTTIAANRASASTTQAPISKPSAKAHEDKWGRWLQDHPETTAMDHVVGMTIMRLTRIEYGNAIADRDYIARIAKVSVRTVSESTSRLARLGFFEITKTKRRSPPDNWRPEQVKRIAQHNLAKHGEDAAYAVSDRLREIERERTFLRAIQKAMRHKCGEGYRMPRSAKPRLTLVPVDRPDGGAA